MTLTVVVASRAGMWNSLVYSGVMVPVTWYTPSGSLTWWPRKLDSAGSAAQPFCTPHTMLSGNGSVAHCCGYGLVCGLPGPVRSGS